MYHHYNAANTKCFAEMLERLLTVFEEMPEDMKIMKRMQTAIYNTIKNQGPATAEPDLSEVILPLCSKKNFFGFENMIKNDKEEFDARVSFLSTLFFSLYVIIWAFVSLVDFQKFFIILFNLLTLS